jgi:hypothetical protein
MKLWKFHWKELQKNREDEERKRKESEYIKEAEVLFFFH